MHVMSKASKKLHQCFELFGCFDEQENLKDCIPSLTITTVVAHSQRATMLCAVQKIVQRFVWRTPQLTINKSGRITHCKSKSSVSSAWQYQQSLLISLISILKGMLTLCSDPAGWNQRSPIRHGWHWYTISATARVKPQQQCPITN